MEIIMKKLGTALFASLFVCSVAFAQNSPNQASQDIDGNNNMSTINQVNAANSEANVKQEGNNNSSLITQYDYSHNASLYNVGDENTIEQTQYGSKQHQRIELWGDQNEFTTFQNGEGHFIYLNARGTGPGLFGRASNGGDNNSNSADIQQRGYKNLFSGSITGSDNEVTVEQTGRYNQIGGALFNSAPAASALSTTSAPTGAFGFIYSLFNGNAWSGNGVNVYGDNNQVQLKQAGNSNTNYAFVEGDENKLVQRMTNGSDNNVLQAMIGEDNKSILELWGDGNTMITGQLGSGNELFMNSRGTGTGFTNGGGNSSNLLVALQIHDDNMISGGIDGSYNKVGILQLGSQNELGSSLYAADGVRVVGNYNTVEIAQLGYGNTATADITGHNNHSTIVQ